MPTPSSDPWLPSAPVPVNRPGAVFSVWKVTGPSGSYTFTALPNVHCLAVEEHEGPAPSSALFRYVFDGRDSSAPQSVEQALGIPAPPSITKVIAENDRIGVSAVRPDGTAEWIFDGLATTWAFTLNRDAEMVSVAASGIAKRLWDAPAGGMVMRDSDDPEASADVKTDLVAQFNPRGEPNASPSTADSGDDPHKYPVFMDPGVRGTDTGGKPYPREWTLAMAAAHLIYVNNPAELYVTNPKRADLDALLVSREPIDGVPYDPNDASTYTASDIIVPDTPVSGRSWVAALADLVTPFGFGLRFALSTDGAGQPVTTLVLWLKQAPPPRSVYLPVRGTPFDASTCNLGSADLARDLSGVVNQWTVRGALKRYEASFVLAPGYPALAADAVDDSSMAPFVEGASGFDTTDNYNKYRLWVFDESGEGHYANTSNALDSGTPTSLDSVLGAPADGVAQYAVRRRPPIGTLFTQDTVGDPLRYRLWLSTDYAGAYPAVWDGTGTWVRVKGGYSLLDDRIGIRINVTDPQQFHYGDHTVAKIVESMANPGTGNPAFFLRLTCVIEGDQCLDQTAVARPTSPVSRTIEREVDARDRYFYGVVAAHSEFNGTASPVIWRDDTDAAKAEASALRQAGEAGVLEGEIEISRFTTWYAVGDRIDGINGRGLGFRTDTAGAGYAPVLPVVVGRRFELDGEQRTFLALSDAGLDRRRYSTRRRPPPPPQKTGRVYAADNVPRTERDNA